MSKLPNAPLQEVIFEIRWALTPSTDSGQRIDEDYELALGRLSSIVDKEFKYHKRVVPDDIPDQLLYYRPVHQYWIEEGKWPVLQLGPGIFTINCTDDEYDWENSFRPLIEKAIEWLMKAYKKPLNIRFASLKYIDAINVNDYGGADDGWQAFIKKHFNIEYSNNFNTIGVEKKIQINQTFELNNGSDLQLQFTDGANNNQKAFIWQTSIIKKGGEFHNIHSLFEWADFAHSTANSLFKKIIKPDLYASFSGKTN